MGYRRVLSRFDATMLVIGSIIGAGVFFTPNDIAAVTQQRGSMTWVWVLGGLIALTGALTYAELGGMFSRAGGVYLFLREAFGDLPAFLYGWGLLLVIAPGAAAIVAGVFAANLGYFVPGLDAAGQTMVALAALIFLTAINIRGVRWGSVVQNLVTTAKLAALAALALGGLVYSGSPVGPLAERTVPAPSHGGMLGIVFAMMPVLFSYGGWQNGTYIAAEMKRPQRDVPWAILGGTLVVIACYLGVNLAYLRVLTPQAIASDRAFAVRAAELALGPLGGGLVAVGILVSTFGICAAILLTNPRVAQAIGEDRLFFPVLGRLHATFDTPAWAIGILGGWACLLLLIGGAGQLLDAVVFVDWVFFAASALSLFVFRRTRPEAVRPYRCPFYPWVPGLFLVLATTMAVASFLKSDWTSRILGPGILAGGVLVFLAYRRTRRAG